MANDYAKRLSRGADECNALIADVLAARLPKSVRARPGPSSSVSPVFETCPYLNISLCPATETNNVSNGSAKVVVSFMFLTVQCDTV